ncbi:MAG TPA: aminotransferase class V-fold PLP-dependent enzyme [Bryobacteraceae bacterium]|nr:aminotransferase class V-fold PLP-dependent enzyme [Bryobacteraceae bacterium]
MSPEEFRKFAHEAVDWMADYLAHSETYPVLPHVKPGELTDALPRCGPEHGEPMSAILADFRNKIVPAATHWNHPGFMAYFAISASGPGILGEMLTATLNMNGMLWKTSPAVVELEQVALDWLRRWIGLPDGLFGIIFDTASTSSMHAIAAAREMVAPEVRTDGGGSGLVIYTSEQSHSSIEKGAIAIGIGQKNVRKIPVDGEYRMRPDALAAAIEQDQAAGLRPFCVVATVGTTSTTSIDPVEQIAPIAERYGAWLHVDAAYAGVAAVAPELQHILRGCERADSLVTNPHKWLFTPVDISILYTRRPEILRRAFSLVPEYLRTADDPRATNYMDYGVPLGHRFRALKLWFVLRYYGREGLAGMIRNHIGWAQELAAQIDAHGHFERTAPTRFSTICFRFKGTDEENRNILERVNASGQVFLSHTVLRGQYCLRLAIGNMKTTREHVQRAWELVQSAAG